VKDFLILLLQLSLALTVAELGKDLVKTLALALWNKVALWAWSVIR
jgi:hypothetical protein